MAVLAPPKRWTREEYQALPEGPPFYELIDGQLIETPSTAEDLREIDALIEERLGPRVRVDGQLIRTPSLFLPDVEECLRPDLVYVSARRKELWQNGGVHGTPDLCIEVVSPPTERLKRRRKLPLYQKAGVAHVWFFSPIRPVGVEEYVFRQDGYYVLQSIVTAPEDWTPALFPDWTLSLAEVDVRVAEPEAPLADER